ncbi:PucR family transcriptional regulator [Metabacillus sp. GX 13764]|uniref:PucR family transcriptional regulator n=1 Tax=Metabacillus kandeliae TaxID=2900151 RepID=UPI001E2CA236|nr:PucR family transcriptional regulator [Metabacillus kandeliae]MCD7036224.1 PucR family transcriptional regulator [Metabacillus kandeliae]
MSALSKDPFAYHFERLEDMADRISEVLLCPITIEDVNHRLLAYSTHDDCTDQARISTIIGRRVPEKVINSLWKDGTIPKLMETDEPVRVSHIDEVGLGNRIAISIWKNKEVIGFIWALEIHKTLDQDDLQLLKKAAQAVKNKMVNLQVRKIKKEERNQELLWKLLTGHLTMQKQISESFEQIQVKEPALFSIALFRFPEKISDTAERQINYLLQTTQQIQIPLSTIDYDKLLVLVDLKEELPLASLKEFSGAVIRQLDERFSIKNVSAAIGGIYSNLALAGKSYREALSALRIKQRLPEETAGLIHFSELGIYQYLDVLREKRQEEGYVNWQLLMLKEYDLEHRTNLVETLEVFLDSDSSVHTAAKALNVHVNTLNYRLKRIAEIAEINLKNQNEKLTIYLDLKLEKLDL